MLNASQTHWIVIKFGGTSVSTHAAWQNIAQIIKQHLTKDQRILVVCSAPSKVSNLLDQLVTEAIHGNDQTIFAAIVKIYQLLAEELGLSFALIQPLFQQLEQWVKGITLLGEASPKVRAKIMAFGELSLTHLGVAYLKTQQISVMWQDVRDLLSTDKASTEQLPEHHPAHFLAAQCASDFDESVVQHLNATPCDVLVTQGFIAKNQAGETVLLGRGGSDLAASYLAAKIGAKACEIWTDVPGVYTANPHQVPEARLLTTLNYEEAQEIASMGAKILHPKCIEPLKKHHIPLWVKCTLTPTLPGTHIINGVDQDGLYIKSIIAKNGTLLISIETVEMWWQVGFLARVFECFKKYGLSIDLVSTSGANVTVSLDANADGQDPKILQALLDELNSFAQATCIGPCATISLVGNHIRGILHRLGPVFSLFEQQQIYLLSQAANDLNLSIVVDEDQAPRLLQELHALLIEQNIALLSEPGFQTFNSLQDQSAAPWWVKQRSTLLQLMDNSQAPHYVYSSARLQEAANQLQACDALDHIFYAMKANYNHTILKIFYEQGLGFECVSLGEVDCILQLFPGIDRKRIIFTPNFAPKTEYEKALTLGITLTIDNIYPLHAWGALFADHNILLRIDPGYGHGHHRYVCTGGSDSKFGIPLSELASVQKYIKQHHIHVIGLHTHAGSGILRPTIWYDNAQVLLSLLDQFPEVRILNIGGGLGIPEKPAQQALDLSAFNASLSEIKKAYPHLHIWLEPGRFLVAAAGVLLARVTQIKHKQGISFIGIETGMNSLIRPALYGSYHEIVNLSKLDQPHTQIAHIVGPICESGDVLGYSRSMPDTKEGDVVLIANTGAYGYSMSSHYNLREPASEAFI
jgi:diaminopimelate decarboxylase/aspartate kinase